MTLGHRVAVLKDGRLQQCAPPRVLYDRPANSFVAGFIGSPAMNLFTVPVARTAPSRSGGGRGGARLPAARSPGAREVVVGFRPEALELARDGIAGARRGGRGARRRRLRLLRRALRRRATRLVARAEAPHAPSAASTSRCGSAPRRGTSVRRGDGQSPELELAGERTTLDFPCLTRRSSTCTSTPSTRSSTGRAASPRSRRARPSSRCRPSGSPTTARSPAPSSSTGRPASTGVKPILGCEVYVADDRRAQTKGNAHLTLLAEDNDGLRQPDQARLGRLPRGLLLQAARRLGAARAPLAGADRALRLPLRPRLQGARGEPRRRRAPPSSTGSRRSSAATTTYVEMQNAHLESSSGSTRCSPSWPSEPGCRSSRPATSTTSAHEDARAHEALLCIQSGDSLKNPNHWKFDTDHFYFKSPEEMALDFPGHDDALRRTLEVAERCNVEIELGRILLPKFPTPDEPRRLRLPRRALRERPRKSATTRSRRSSASGSSSSSRRSRRWASPTTS